MDKKQTKKGNKNGFYLIDKKLVENGIFLCIVNSQKLLADCKTLLKTNSSLSSVLGLYTFSLEEFGKYLLLRDILGQSNTYQCKVSKDIFSNHRKKIDRALEE